MKQQRIQLIFFYFFILAVLVLNFFIFLPYISVLFLALVFAILFEPVHQKILVAFGNRQTVSALITVLLVFLIIVGPLSFLGTLLFQEASNLYTSVISSNGNEQFNNSISAFQSGVSQYFPTVNIAFLEGDTKSYIEAGLSWFLKHFSVVFSGAVSIAFGLFLMLLALFYFFKDGKTLVETLINLSPLEDENDRKIIDRISVAVNSVVRGNLVIGVIQGVLTGLGFFIFGVPSPVIWGTVAAIMSLIPTVGTSTVLIPGIIFVFFSSGPLYGLGLLIWGFFAVGLIDNFLGPTLIHRGIHIHPFLILLSVFGGLSLFGPIGFIAGPVILSILFSLFDLYPAVVKGSSVSE